MTYRAGRSYVRFPERFRTFPEAGLKPASAMMDRLLREDKRGNNLRDQPAVTKSQNVFSGLED